MIRIQPNQKNLQSYTTGSLVAGSLHAVGRMSLDSWALGCPGTDNILFQGRMRSFLKELCNNKNENIHNKNNLLFFTNMFIKSTEKTFINQNKIDVSYQISVGKRLNFAQSLYFMFT